MENQHRQIFDYLNIIRSMHELDEDFKIELLNIHAAVEHVVAILANKDFHLMKVTEPHNDYFVEEMNRLVALFQRYHSDMPSKIETSFNKEQLRKEFQSKFRVPDGVHYNPNYDTYQTNYNYTDCYPYNDKWKVWCSAYELFQENNETKK